MGHWGGVQFVLFWPGVTEVLKIFEDCLWAGLTDDPWASIRAGISNWRGRVIWRRAGFSRAFNAAAMHVGVPRPCVERNPRASSGGATQLIVYSRSRL